MDVEKKWLEKFFRVFSLDEFLKLLLSYICIVNEVNKIVYIVIKDMWNVMKIYFFKLFYEKNIIWIISLIIWIYL